jgi:hypothetical protein
MRRGRSPKASVANLYQAWLIELFDKPGGTARVRWKAGKKKTVFLAALYSNAKGTLP